MAPFESFNIYLLIIYQQVVISKTFKRACRQDFFFLNSRCDSTYGEGVIIVIYSLADSSYSVRRCKMSYKSTPVLETSHHSLTNMAEAL